jgi:hypothetical protein
MQRERQFISLDVSRKNTGSGFVTALPEASHLYFVDGARESKCRIA